MLKTLQRFTTSREDRTKACKLSWIELAKKLNDKIPKTVDEMFERVRAFIKGEVVAGSSEMARPSQWDKWNVHSAWSGGPEKARNRGGPREIQRNIGIYTLYPRKDTFTPLIKTPKEILAMESVSFPELPPLIGTPKKLNLNKFFDYHGDKGHNTNDCYQLKKQIEEVVVEGKLDHLVKDIHRNNQRNKSQGRNNVKVINMIRGGGSRKRPFEGERSEGFLSTTEVYQISCMNIASEASMLTSGRNKMMLMEFAIIKCRSLYNVIIGRTGMRSLGVVGFTIHFMITFPTNQGIVTMETSRELCRNVDNWKGCKVRGRSQERPNQHVTIETTLIADCKWLLTEVLRENIEVFAWAGSERTVVPRFVMEHQLKIYPLAEPVVPKRRPLTPDERQALKERVFDWLKEWTIRKVQHPEWVANTIPIKLANGTWKVQVDYSSLNKVCAKDMYPFPEEGEELASLMEYPYKCFLRLPKGYNQIRMAENDEEKTGFHMEEGVYCFTHMPKGLKNSTATLQRMMEKVLTDQRGRNVEVYLKEIVVKSKSEQSLV
ncbi:hypothetical protein Tco_1446405 [Tanacetum coccineum]